jgi:putative mycofactocin binding protein MftB
MVSVPLDRTITVHPRVSIRPEPFGALLYHFGTRQLSFLKDRRLLETVRACDGTRTLRAALAEAGVPDTQTERYGRAVMTLIASSMLVQQADDTKEKAA